MLRQFAHSQLGRFVTYAWRLYVVPRNERFILY